MNEEKRCPSCGELIEPDASKCDNCGRSLFEADFDSDQDSPDDKKDDIEIGEEIEGSMPSGLSSLGDMIEKKVMATVKKREKNIRESMKKNVREREKEIREEMQERIENLREEHKEERSELMDKIEKERGEKEQVREELEEKNEKLRNKIDELKAKQEEEKDELREEYEKKIEDLNEKISKLKDEHMEEKEEIREDLKEEKEELRERYETEKKELQDELDELREKLEKKEEESKEKIDELRENAKEEKEELREKLNEEKEELKYDLEKEKVDLKNRLNERIDDLQERLEEEKEKRTGLMVGGQISMPGGEFEGEGGLTEQIETKLNEPVYPFPAIVGQERMKRALLLNVINPNINGVLAWGEKGFGKRTALVGIAELVAGIEEVNEKEDEDIKVWNDKDRYVAGTIHTHKTDSQVMIDTVLGNGAMTIKEMDKSTDTDTPTITVKNLTPADKYMLSYVDTLDLHVKCEMIEDLDKRREIIKRKRAYEEDPEGFYKEYEDQIHDLRDRIVRTRQTMPSVTVGSRQRNTISNLSAHASLPSGVDILLEEVSRTLTAYDGREEVTDDDIKEGVDLMFTSRIREELLEEI